MSPPDIDDIDRGILFALQRDARNTTNEEIAAQVDVASSTVRNRIERLESDGVIEGYHPKINYEKAAFPLHVQFVCSAPATERNRLAREALDTCGVVAVREMLAGKHNLYVETVATNTEDLTTITNELAALGLEIESSEVFANYYAAPWNHFEFDPDVE